MYTINDAEIKTAIRASTAFQDFNIVRIKVAGVLVYEDCNTSTRYQVAIQHKIIENGDNASVYEVSKYADGRVFAYFNGTFKVAKDGSLDHCTNVEYGGFSNKMARDWLSLVFTGPTEEIPSEQIEEPVETPSEVSEEPAEGYIMNDYTKKELALNGERLLESQQVVVGALGRLDEAQYFLHTMMRSFHFYDLPDEGEPKAFTDKANDFNARIVKIHNLMYELSNDMHDAYRQVCPEVDE